MSHELDQWTQEWKLLTVASPLGEDVFLLQRLSGREAISELFRFELDLISQDHCIDFDSMIGQSITVGIRLADGAKQRYINGLVSRFVQLPPEGRLARYSAEIVPRMWFLTRASDCRIYQQATAVEIIEDVFRRFGLTDFENQLKKTYHKREYCVQYRETACQFVMRLMEEEGIWFFHRHENGRHYLVLADSPSAVKPCPNADTVRFEHDVERVNRDEEVVYFWRFEHELRPGRYSHGDFNFMDPLFPLMTSVESSIDQGGNKSYEIYDYPGSYTSLNEGESLVRVRMEEEERQHHSAGGTASVRTFCPGFKFTLTDHPRADQNDTYLITAVEHECTDTGYYSGIGSSTEASYENVFTCIPASVPYRPLRVTPKPHMRGTQTAIVTGPSGEEIYTDKHGRVKVQFHWDRLGKYDDSSSCWIRVAQPWAGSGWGAMWIPRIGQEVIVDFLEGDPDRPIITGSVYNGVQVPPYELPAKQTISTFKSNTSKDGQGFNEIRFEDARDKEQLFIHAQRDQDNRTLNDYRRWVGHDSHLIVKNDRFEQVENQEHRTVFKEHYEQFQSSAHKTIEGKRIELVKGEDHHKVDSGRVTKISGDEDIDIGGALVLKTGASESRKIGGDSQSKIGMKYAVDSGMEIHLKAGMKVVIEAGMQVTLKGAGGFVDVGPAGVTIQGNMVLINSGGAAGTGSGSSPATPKSPDRPEKPQEPQEADTAAGGKSSVVKVTRQPPPELPPVLSPKAATLKNAAASGQPFCDL